MKVCVFECRRLTLKRSPIATAVVPSFPVCRETRTVDASGPFKTQTHENLLFQLTFVTSGCQWSQLCTLTRLLLLFLQGGLHDNEQLVQHRWARERGEWYARAFSLAGFSGVGKTASSIYGNGQSWGSHYGCCCVCPQNSQRWGIGDCSDRLFLC